MGSFPAMDLTCQVLSPSAASSHPWSGYHLLVLGSGPGAQFLEGSGSLSAWTLPRKNLIIPSGGEGGKEE